MQVPTSAAATAFGILIAVFLREYRQTGPLEEHPWGASGSMLHLVWRLSLTLGLEGRRPPRLLTDQRAHCCLRRRLRVELGNGWKAAWQRQGGGLQYWDLK